MQMESSIKKIAIVGGGFAGVCAISCLKEVGGFEPVCFEKTDRCGGTWSYREESVIGVASTMSTTIINHSKEMGAVSNFPPRKEYNNFMRHDELLQYMTEYAEAHDVFRHIQYHSDVIEVKRSDDYEETGRWMVTVKDTKKDRIYSDIYDGVWLCAGHINRPKMPNYPGQDSFKGKIMHTHTLKEVVEFRNKKVLVVGMGCSGLDAAVESSSVAKQVYLSTRSGAHVISRTGPSGYPYDYLLLRRYITKFIDILPRNTASWLIETLYMDRQFDHRLYPVPPDHHILSKDPVLNDHIWSKLHSGTIIQKPDIESFTENGVIFRDSSDVIDVDVVVMATGYTWGFPFLEEGIVVQEDDIINLYKCMFPPHLPHSTFVVIGFALPFGPGFPIGELMCRFAAHIFAGKGKLPSKEVMLQDAVERHSRNMLSYTPSEKMTVRVDFTQFLDELASEFGVKPNLRKICFTDFRLFLKLIFGPCLSYQYRLQGPFKWDGAREAIMTCDERLHFPITRRETKELENSLIMKIVKKILRWCLSYQ